MLMCSSLISHFPHSSFPESGNCIFQLRPHLRLTVFSALSRNWSIHCLLTILKFSSFPWNDELFTNTTFQTWAFSPVFKIKLSLYRIYLQAHTAWRPPTSTFSLPWEPQVSFLDNDYGSASPWIVWVQSIESRCSVSSVMPSLKVRPHNCGWDSCVSGNTKMSPTSAINWSLGLECFAYRAGTVAVWATFTANTCQSTNTSSLNAP
jgi:hypothetical protein